MKKLLLVTLCTIHVFTMHAKQESAPKKSKEIAWIKAGSGAALIYIGLNLIVAGGAMHSYKPYKRLSIKSPEFNLPSQQQVVSPQISARPKKSSIWIGPGLIGAGCLLSIKGYQLIKNGLNDFEEIAQNQN